MKIYIATGIEYEGIDILGIFDTREGAEACLKRAASDNLDSLDVKEYELNQDVVMSRPWRREKPSEQ